MWISSAYRSYTDHIKLMLRLKNKKGRKITPFVDECKQPEGEERTPRN